MKHKKALLSISIFALVSVLTVGIIFAWVVQYRRSMMVVTGDASISVDGWFDVVSDVNSIEFTDEKKLNKLTDNKENIFNNLSENQFIAYKFQVTNLSIRDARLSMRLSNMFDYIFDHFSDYIKNNGEITEIDMTAFERTAEKNNGRLTLMLNNLYYEYEKNGVVSEPYYFEKDDGKDPYLWKYSRGEKFIGTDGDNMRSKTGSVLLPAIDNDNEKTKVNIYITLTNSQSTVAIDAYKKWFLGDDETAGAGQEQAANLLGYTWEKLKSDNSPSIPHINAYLEKFIASEIQSITPDDEDGSKFNLTINYFEFIGENVPDKAV